MFVTNAVVVRGFAALREVVSRIREAPHVDVRAEVGPPVAWSTSAHVTADTAMENERSEEET